MINRLNGMVLAGVALGSAVFSHPTLSQARVVPFAEGPVISVAVSFPPTNPDELFGGRIVWAFNRTLPFHNSSVPQWSRILVDEIQLAGPGDYFIDFADGSGNIIETLAFGDLDGRSQVWSMLAPGGSLSVRVRGTEAAEKLSFRLSAIAFDFNAVAEKSLVGDVNGLTDVALYNGALAEEVQRVSPSVAKLEYVRDGSKYTCSGFLVDSTKLVTNAHCVDSQAICDTAIAVFGYQKLSHGGISLGDQYRCGTFLGADTTIDAAAVVLTKRPDEADDTRKPLELAARPVALNEPLLLVQHPGGSPKMVSVEGCSASTLPTDGSDMQNADFQHGCDTEQGSSGSPVVAADGSVVGLHKIGHGLDPDSGRHNTAVDARALADWLRRSGHLPGNDGDVMSISQGGTPPPVSSEAGSGETPAEGEQNCDEVNTENCPEAFRVPEDRRNAQPLPLPSVDDEDLTETEGGTTAGEGDSVSEPGSQGTGTSD